MSDNTLIVFLKYPEPGKVKTRLAREIGNAEAADLYRGFVETILENTKSGSYDRVLFYSPLDRVGEFIKWLGPEEVLSPQDGKDLGERLQNAFSKVFDRGVKKVVAIGTDSPFIDESTIKEAFAELEENDCVVGPSKDGGYYLLGLSVQTTELFKDIQWSTSVVFDQTLKRAEDSGLKICLMENGYDIDTYEDLVLMEHES